MERGLLPPAARKHIAHISDLEVEQDPPGSWNKGDPFNRSKNKESLYSNVNGSCFWTSVPANTTAVELSWVGHSLAAEVSEFKIFTGEVQRLVSNYARFDGVVRIIASEEIKFPVDRPGLKLGICVTKSQESTPVEIIMLAFIF